MPSKLSENLLPDTSLLRRQLGVYTEEVNKNYPHGLKNILWLNNNDKQNRLSKVDLSNGYHKNNSTLYHDQVYEKWKEC